MILAREVWEAWGHLAVFTDPLTECQSLPQAVPRRPPEEALEEKHGPAGDGLADVACPNCGDPRPVHRAAGSSTAC